MSVQIYLLNNQPLILHTVYSTRLRNIEETEKAKRAVAEERKERRHVSHDEDHLAATRCMIAPFLLFH